MQALTFFELKVYFYLGEIDKIVRIFSMGKERKEKTFV
jgi:hypothetical protein